MPVIAGPRMRLDRNLIHVFFAGFRPMERSLKLALLSFRQQSGSIPENSGSAIPRRGRIRRNSFEPFWFPASGWELDGFGQLDREAEKWGAEANYWTQISAGGETAFECRSNPK
jgi:hypothetical protein